MFGDPVYALGSLPGAPMFETRTETVTRSERATLTFTQHGTVLGTPVDATEEETAKARAAVIAWGESDGRTLLVLPWPVDVTDLLT